jgi:PTS system nitrogen regulatory IIA component
VNFGYLLRTLRICAGLSLRELARTIDVSPTYLSLIENGKQPPPNPSRIAKIEKALEVPPGYLLSLARGFDPKVLSFIQHVPEVVDFLHVASEKHLSADDFTNLTAFLNAYDRERLRQALQVAVSPEPKPMEAASFGTYLWPFLDEDLVFDMIDTHEKEDFLKEAVEHICRHCNGIKSQDVLSELLKREKIASTGIGRGIAVPHAYISGFDRMVVALVRIPQGLQFHAVDGEPVHLAVILAGPRSSKNLHLLLLARIAKLARNRNFFQKLLKVSTAKEIISAFREAETTIPEIRPA